MKDRWGINRNDGKEKDKELIKMLEICWSLKKSDFKTMRHSTSLVMNKRLSWLLKSNRTFVMFGTVKFNYQN